MQVTTVRLPGGAELDCYVLDPKIATGTNRTRPAMIICPGGAYLKTATREREVIAARFLGMGFHAFVLRYHTYIVAGDPASGDGGEGAPRRLDRGSHYPVQVIDLMQAMSYVREHAEPWHVDPELIYALGFSAGGHIVGSLAERFDDAALLDRAGAEPSAVKPRGVLLCYPMVDGGLVRDVMEDEGRDQGDPFSGSVLSQALFGTSDPSEEDYGSVDLSRGVRPDMPRMFVWQTSEDDLLDAADTVSFVAAAMRAGASCEFHLFQRGQHGLALCDETTALKPEDVNRAAAAWLGLAKAWLDLDIADAASGLPRP